MQRSLAELVAAAEGGDQGAWTELVDRFSGAIWATARSHRLGAADAADVAQTVWLRLVEHLGRIDDPERLPGWIMTTARRECLRVLASGRRVTALPESHEPVDPRGGPAQTLATGERDALLRSALAELGERCQHLLRLLSLEPPPDYAAVGAALDMPIGSIGPTRARCLDQLRRRCEVRGITAAS